MTESSPDFANDIYAQTLDQLKAHHKQEEPNCVRAFDKGEKWGWLNQTWAGILLPLLYTILTIAAINWLLRNTQALQAIVGLLQQIYPQSEEHEFQTLAFFWLVRLTQLPLIMLGMWATTGAGKWYGWQFWTLFIIQAIVYGFPPTLPAQGFSISLTTFLGIIMLTIAAYGLSLLSYSTGRKAGELISVLTTIEYPLAKVFPAIGGRPVPEVTNRAYLLLKQRLSLDSDTRQRELDYITATAQAHLDISETMSLPWGIIMTIVSLEALKILVPDSYEFAVVLPLILLAAMGTFQIAYHAILQASIIQATAQIRRELPQPTTGPEPFGSLFAWLRHK